LEAEILELPFNAYEFELFYHAQPTVEETKTLPIDYVPEYPWWDRAVEEMQAREAFNRRYFSVTSSLDSGETKVTFVTFSSEKELLPVSPKLALIEARRSVNVAQAQMESYSWQEVEPYIFALRDAMKAFEREHKPVCAPLRLLRGGFRK
jgi:hypothetical protein